MVLSDAKECNECVGFSSFHILYSKYMPKQQRKTAWLYTDMEMLSSPSVRLGETTAREIQNRNRACRMIERVGKAVLMPQSQTNMAKVLLHRFYMRESMQKAEYHEIAATLVFMAGKLGSGSGFVKIDKIIQKSAEDAFKKYIDASEGTNV